MTDAISQGIDILFKGGTYNWKQGLISFGIGFIMPAISEGVQRGFNKIVKNSVKKYLGGMAVRPVNGVVIL